MGKKGRKNQNFDDDFAEPEEESVPVVDTKVEETEITGKKKGKKGKNMIGEEKIGHKGNGKEERENEWSTKESTFDALEEEKVEEVKHKEYGKKGKKKGKKTSFDDDFEDEAKELKSDEKSVDSRNDSGVSVSKKTVAEEVRPFAGKKKSKKGKKGFFADDSEEDEPNEKLSKRTVIPIEEGLANFSKKGDDSDEEGVAKSFSGKKLSKKGKKVEWAADEKFDKESDNSDGETKPKKGGLGQLKNAWELLGEEESENVDEEPKEGEESEKVKEDTTVFKGKKKSKKGAKPAWAEDEEEEEKSTVTAEVEENQGEKEVLFAGKKKSKKGKKPAWAEDEESESVQPGQAEDGDDNLVFTGNKKGRKGKQKPSEEDINALLAEIDAKEKPAPEMDEITEQSTQSGSLLEESAGGKDKGKKGKKGKKVKQPTKTEEEEDIDAILAQLEGPKASEPQEKTTPPAIASEVQKDEAQEVKVEEETVVESAAAKKKKKKKEKEKAKKAEEKTKEGNEEAEAAEESKSKGKTDLKKLPKHVREMQERLQRIKEAEEKQKREEEERRRKEEEEAARLAEIERQKEEAKRRKKEKEKEKIAQLKREGKYLTAKEKEERKKLAAFRERLLASQQAEKEEAEKSKKVVYEKKKKKGPTTTEAKGVKSAEEASALAAMEANPPPPASETIGEKAEVKVEEKTEEVAKVATEVKQVEEEEEEDSWDAKSWDDETVLSTLKKPAGTVHDDEEKAQGNVASNIPKAEDEKEVEGKEATKAEKEEGVEKEGVVQKEEEQSDEEEEDESEEESEEESDEESETESEDEESEEESEDEEEKRREAARKKREDRKAEALKNRSATDLRSPICCILGHVDTGKTKLLDCIRRTNVQEGEAGGITQQIGATYFPAENIKERTKDIKADADLKVPGLLIIDTPGHESFTNLRSRGSGLCDIAILVIDIMHGLEQQTLESLNLLKMRKTPFIVALNKVDRMYGWVPKKNAPLRHSLKEQKKDSVLEFERRTAGVITQLMEQGMNASLYWQNPDFRKYISVVPTSAVTGEGVPDLLMVLVQLTQKMMQERLMYIAEVQCTVLEVKVIEGLGTTIDVVLVNGILREGDQVVVCGMQGPIVTTIRALLTPHPMRELRVKGSYLHHKELKAAQGIKITAQGLEHAIAGTQLYVVGPDDDLEDIKDEAMQDMKGVLSRIDKSGEGVCVQASTLGSLEALLEFLKSPDVKIPVSGISIGPVHKKDVMRASVMLERKRKEYAVILAFDVKVSPEAQEMARELGVRIFTADIIYHLFDQFTAYMKEVKDKAREESAEDAVFPVILKILPNCIFNKKDPIVLGVEVAEGVARLGTPICIPSQGFIDIGKIASMEKDHKVVEVAKKGQAVAMKIVGSNPEEVQKSFGRHFSEEDELVSHISRKSIDVLKEHFRNDLTKEEWILVVKLKKLFDIA